MWSARLAKISRSTSLFTFRTAIVLLLSLGNGFDLVPYSNFRVTIYFSDSFPVRYTI